MLLAGCAQYGGILPDSGRTGERIETAVMELDREITSVGTVSDTTGFHRYYSVRVGLGAHEPMSVQVLEDVLTAVVGAVKSPRIYGIRLNIFQDPADGAQGGWVDLEQYVEELVGDHPDPGQWMLSGADNDRLIVSLEDAREFLKERE